VDQRDAESSLRDACAERRALLPAAGRGEHARDSTRPAFYAEIPVDGVYLRDWLARGIASDPTLANQVEEGELVEAYPGVAPFACDVAP
jgi:hypothetical protein